MKKKLFSILLSLAMVLTMIPFATMTAFADISTVADVLNTNPYFPTSEAPDYEVPDNAWTSDNGHCLFRDLTAICCDSDENRLFPENAPVTAGENKYTYSPHEGFTAVFNMTDGVLTSILLRGDGAAEYAGLYTPPVTVADILPEDFPTGTPSSIPKNAWVAENGNTICYCTEAESLMLANNSNISYIPDSSVLNKLENDNYQGGFLFVEGSFTFVMNNGKLDSVIIEYTDPDYQALNGTYTPAPAPTPAPTPDNTDKGVKTGDSSDIIFYGFTTLLALLGAGFVYGLRRKEEK